MSSFYSRLIIKNNEGGTIQPVVLFSGIFCLYLIIRIIAWQNNILLEDTGSLSKLRTIKVFLTFNLQNIIDLDPDRALFYPFFGALFNLPGWSLETGARLCSLFFSSLLFIAVAGIGRQIANSMEIGIGLSVLSFSHVLIFLSFAILLEPSYIAMVYLGFWCFWSQYREPVLWKAGLIGVILGLSFLNRVEGLVYLIAIPFLQGIYFLIKKSTHFNFKRFIAWSIIFLTCFSLLAIPQILRVSYKVGAFAINGRQIWSLMYHHQDGKSLTEKRSGLDYSPSERNIIYLKSHPEIWKQWAVDIKIRDYIKTIVYNFSDLYQNQLGIMIGPFGLIFFGFGLFRIYQAGRRFDIFLILSFIAFGLAAPLLHDVEIRHIAVIAPIMFLIEGVGILYLSNRLLDNFEKPWLKNYLLVFIFLCCLIGASAVQLKKIFEPHVGNSEYSPMELKEPVAIVKKITKEELHREPVVSSERGYLAYYAGGKQVYVPFADYEKFIKYLALNEVDFLYLKHKRLTKYPFFGAFLGNSPPNHFTLLYSGVDLSGGKIELYRFNYKENNNGN